MRFNQSERMMSGLITYLETLPGVKDCKFFKKQPSTPISISYWELKNNLKLPIDLAQFFMCTDGLLISWKSGVQQTDELIGKMDILGIDSFKSNEDNLYLIEDSHPYGKTFMRFSDQEVEIIFQETLSQGLSFSCLLIRGWQTGFGSGISKWTNNWMCFYCPKIIDMLDRRIPLNKELERERVDKGNAFSLEKIIQYIKE